MTLKVAQETEEQFIAGGKEIGFLGNPIKGKGRIIWFTCGEGNAFLPMLADMCRYAERIHPISFNGGAWLLGDRYDEHGMRLRDIISEQLQEAVHAMKWNTLVLASHWPCVFAPKNLSFRDVVYKTAEGARVLDGLMDGVDLIAEIHVGCGLKREIHNLDFRHEHFDKVLSIDQQNSFW